MAELYLVEFKGSRKEYFLNSYHHALRISEYVIVQAEQGEDMGRLLKKLDSTPNFPEAQRPRSILRPAVPEDRTYHDDLRRKELQYKKEMLQLVRRHGLVMKVIDCEHQYDGNKITFYFTAEHRVDFRSLVRDLAARYRTRIELRQIGVRDEARRTDGYGICGRRQCCNTHIREFAPISTSHAREQDLSLNPSKISGNCGRLLCCLRYEVDTYAAVRKMFPSIGSLIESTQGNGVLQRIDIFKEEAVVMQEDGTVLRIKRADILKARQGLSPEVVASVAPSIQDYDETANGGKSSRDILRKLDEPDAGQ